LFFGCEQTDANPYIQATNGAGTNADKKLLLNPWGGNVGIGATNPGQKLEVFDGNTSLEYLFLKDISRVTTDKWVLGTEGDKSLQFNYNGGGSAEFIIDSDGNVGIGTASLDSYKLKVNGDVHANSYFPTSDDRVKHNEQPIVGALETLSKVTPKKYIKTVEMYDANHDFELDADGNPIDANGELVEHSIEAGVIAQQVLTVDELAFAVSPEGVDEDGVVTSPHGLDYNSLFTYAIAAIQEQQQIIDQLKSRIETLEQQ